MSYTEINKEKIERRKQRLFDDYGEVPVETREYELPPQEFEDDIKMSKEGYIGSAYVWVIRSPEDVEMSQETVREVGIDSPSVLMILGRNGTKWGVPGGGREGDETFEEAARREVREEISIECSITDLYSLRHRTLVSEGSHDERLHSLSVFFDGVYQDGRIAVQDDEVNGAAWFVRPPAEDRMYPFNQRRSEDWEWE